MKRELDSVAKFHRAFDCVINETFSPHQPIDIIEVRNALLQEEAAELYNATIDGNQIAILDGLADCLFVLLGTAHTFGVARHLSAAFDEVCRSNMSKLDGNGNPVVRPDGKILKGENYSPPDIRSIIGEGGNV